MIVGEASLTDPSVAMLKNCCLTLNQWKYGPGSSWNRLSIR